MFWVFSEYHYYYNSFSHFPVLHLHDPDRQSITTLISITPLGDLPKLKQKSVHNCKIPSTKKPLTLTNNKRELTERKYHTEVSPVVFCFIMTLILFSKYSTYFHECSVKHCITPCNLHDILKEKNTFKAKHLVLNTVHHSNKLTLKLFLIK